MTLAMSLFALVFTMKFLGVTIRLNFPFWAITLWVLLPSQLVGNFVVLCPYVCRPINVTSTMLSTSLTPFDIHDHLVQNNMCKEAMEELVVLVEGEVSCTLGGKSFCSCFVCK